MILVRSLVGCVYHLLGLLLHTVCRCEVEKRGWEGGGGEPGGRGRPPPGGGGGGGG